MAIPNKEAELPPADTPNTPIADEHSRFILKFDDSAGEFEFVMSEFLRVGSVYWTLTSMDIMGREDEVVAQEILDYVQSCYHPSAGGFSATPRHDPHILSTLSAVQIACTLGARDALDADAICANVKGLQNGDGSFCAERGRVEVDARFSFAALAVLTLLDRTKDIDVEKATRYVLSCRNSDGGFGCRPGAQSHVSLVYCCLGFLSLAGRLEAVEAGKVGGWLAERQEPPAEKNKENKMPDVCYVWWILSSLTIIGKLHLVDSAKTTSFLRSSLEPADETAGGTSVRPGDTSSDPFHTLFGVAALSLLQQDNDGDGGGEFKTVDPVFCMSKHVLDGLGIRTARLAAAAAKK